MPNPSKPIAVLLMAMGGPDCLENVEPFLLDVRGGRPTPPELVAEIQARYRATGGKSPAVGITFSVARKLETRLNESGERRYRVYVGLRHWHPFIKDTLAQLLRDRGDHTGARQLLKPICDWFSEGAGMPDLVAARTLLGGLGR